MIKFTRTQAQMICRNPAAYEVAKVQEAACHLLGYLDASPEEIQDACAAVEATPVLVETRETLMRRPSDVQFRVVLPDGNGRIVWADRVPEVGNTLTGYFNGWRVYDVTPQAFGARLPVACVN